MTPENPNDEKSSLLSDIIKASQGSTEINPEAGSEKSKDTGLGTNTVPKSTEGFSPIPPKKSREPLPPGTILKAFGALFLAGVIFFASFLAYIVFNPGEAQFFIVMFGIDTNDVATILRKFINGSFGIIMVIFAILWFIVLFRAIWTPKEQKRKKILAWMTATLIGILLFSILTFWIFLFKKIGEIVWDGGIIGVYDNTLYSNPISKDSADINTTQNMIGPITLRYDIRGNAKSHEANGSIIISRYEINFDGANCADGRSIVTGTNPKEEQGIICTFDTIKNYNIRGSYFGKDITGESLEIPMDLESVEIRGLVDVREQKNTSGKDIITFDATRLALLGEVRWVYENTGDEVKTPNITLEPSESPLFIFLKVFGNSPDRIFLVQKKELSQGNERIEAVQSTLDSREFTMYLTGITADMNSIVSIDWTLNDGIVICRGGNEVCQFNFGSYGKQTVEAKISFANNTERTVSREFNVEKPLTLIRHVIVTGSNGKQINPQSTFDQVLNTYIIDNIIPPDKITLDARDVVPENPGYELTKVIWKMTDGRNTVEKIGERVTFDISNTYRYNIVGTYTFEKNIPGNAPEVKYATDNITIDVEHKTLIPRLSIIQKSDYVPVAITVDASQSWSESNEIIKFIYNFGEGKQDAVGDAIQNYIYTTPGEKEITLTIIDDSGERSQIKQTLVLKEAPRTLKFVPSISEGLVGIPVDFTVTVANGQIEDYTWTFSDNTPTQRGMSVSHIFKNAGIYDITLTATFSDGTQLREIQSFEVIPAE